MTTTTTPPPSAAAAPNKPTLYLLDPIPAPAIAHARTLFSPTAVVLPSDPEIANWRASATAILVREHPITAADIASAPHLRAIGKQGTGIDIIDAAACAARGIPILNTPGLNAGAVAELALALALAAARELRSVVVGQVQAGGEAVVRKEDCVGVTLAGKAVGVVGMGAVGTAVARMFVGAFGARVWACDPGAPAGAWGDIEHVRVGALEEMLPRVDVLTLHVPLTEETRGMVGMRELRLMRRGAFLLMFRGGALWMRRRCGGRWRMGSFGGLGWTAMRRSRRRWPSMRPCGRRGRSSVRRILALLRLKLRSGRPWRPSITFTGT